MRLKKIKIQNYKAIKDLNLTVDGNIYLVKGDNDKGKTTFGRAFQRLVTKMDKPEMPVTQGEARGTIEGRFETKDGAVYTVLLDFTNDKETIRMVTPDGLSTSKVGEIREFFNYTNVDVEEFISWSNTAEGRRKQREIVLGLLPAKAKARFAELETLEKETYDKRTERNHAVKYISTIKNDLVPSDDDVEIMAHEEDIISEFNTLKEKYDNAERYSSEVTLKKEQISNKTTAIETEKEQHTERMETKSDMLSDLAKEIDELQRKLEEKGQEKVRLEKEMQETFKIHKEKLKSYEEELTELEKELEAIPTGDPGTIKDEYDTARARYDCLTAAKKNKLRYAEACSNLEAEEKSVADLSENISSIRKEKETLIVESNLPVKGLSVEDSGITLKGLPFTKEQLSTSEILITVFHIMAALNEKTPIFYLGRVESLGKAKLDEILKVAEEKGYQLFLDKVESGEDLTIEMYEDLK